MYSCPHWQELSCQWTTCYIHAAYFNFPWNQSQNMPLSSISFSCRKWLPPSLPHHLLPYSRVGFSKLLPLKSKGFAVQFPRQQNYWVGTTQETPAPATVTHQWSVKGSGTLNVNGISVEHCQASRSPLGIKEVTRRVLALAMRLPKAHSPQSYCSPSYQRLGKNTGLNFDLHSWGKKKKKRRATCSNVLESWEEQSSKLLFCQAEHAPSRTQPARGFVVLSHKYARWL